MVVRILLMLLALFLIINLVITAACCISGENIYKKYWRQLTVGIAVFALVVAAFYLAIVIFSLKV